MATRTWRGTTNSNWGTLTNWLEGAVPTSADDVIFDTSSPNCTVNVAASCLSITFTSYPATITMTSSISVSTAGTITITGNNVAATGISYLILNNGTTTLTFNGFAWGGSLMLSGGTSSTHTLTTNAIIGKTLIIGNGSGSQTIALNGLFTLYVGNESTGSIQFLGAGGSILNGTATIELSGQGGVGIITFFSIRTFTLNVNFNINTKGTLVIYDIVDPTNTGTPALLGVNYAWLILGSKTYTYVAGTVITRNNTNRLGGSLSLTSGATLINFDKISFANVWLPSGGSITMNRFFNGNAKTICNVQSSATTCTVTFQDTIEKFSHYTRIGGCIIANRNQLLATYPRANKGTNTGIRYYNQMPNGIAKRTTVLPTNTAGSNIVPMFGGLVSDPTTVF